MEKVIAIKIRKNPAAPEVTLFDEMGVKTTLQNLAFLIRNSDPNDMGEIILTQRIRRTGEDMK